MTVLEEVSSSAPRVLPLRLCRDVALVGGKAANLGELIRAGFDVPDGFVITTAAFADARSAASRGASGNGSRDAGITHELAQQIQHQYELLGGGAVAVRSSATAEDMVGASMAGQYDTFLDVRSDAELLERVSQCWQSVDSPRTRAYLAGQDIAADRVAMAVVVQKLVSADVAGVLFTVNPRSGDEQQMLIEGSWGLGESVVAGEVQPDTLTISRSDGRVIDAVIAEKRTWIDPQAGRVCDVPDRERRRSCLSSRDVHALWQVGRQAEKHFARPQDVEWAISDGRLYVLQSRAVTTVEPLRQRRQALEAAREGARTMLAAGHGPWVLHNISETLSHPTPLTWSVIRRFLSGAGGFGVMYREVGFEPGTRVQEAGIADCIGGQIYMDVARAPEMFFADFPFAYDPAVLAADPGAGQSPPTLPRGSAVARYRIGRRLRAVHARIQQLAASLDRKLENELLPAFEQWLAQQQAIDLSSLDDEQLLSAWDERHRRVMDEFAPQSLLPSMIVGQVQAELRTFLAEHLWEENVTRIVQEVSTTGDADETILANQMLHDVGAGKQDLDGWLAKYGHRAPGELDLATPRWRERPDDVRRLAEQLAGGADPTRRHHDQKAALQEKVRRLRQRLPRTAQTQFDELLDLLRRYVPYRENGKYHLMRGYALLRDVAMEIGRRLAIGDGVFFLDESEMKASLRSGFAPLGVIQHRESRGSAQRKLDLPRLIDAAWASGAEPERSTDATEPGRSCWRGFSISPGVGRGGVWVVEDPTTPPTRENGYILVCRTTDPSWTPLFVNASGLVLETGGALSHGAIVAREMGVPAVVLPQARQLLQGAGEAIVDGDRGVVALADDAAPARDPEPRVENPNDTDIAPVLLPPPPSAKERAASAWRDRTAVFWLVGLGLMFLLPPGWLYEPALGVLDKVLWPIVGEIGAIWGTAAIAAGLAALTMAGQYLLTDNTRLRIAKAKAKVLREAAEALPTGAPRWRVLSVAVGAVQRRVLGAAMVPVALLLGPLVLIFMWLPLRVDPAMTPPPVGARIIVKATVHGDHLEPVVLDPGQLKLAGAEASQAVPTIRGALLQLRQEWSSSGEPADGAPALPWHVLAAGRMARQALLADLDRFLAGPVPPQLLAWTLRAPDEPGIYELKLNTANTPTVKLHVAVGERSLPQATSLSPDPSSIQSVEVVYPPKLEKDLLLARPFQSLGWHWDIGWLGVYLAAYLPTMLLCRAVLRVA